MIMCHNWYFFFILHPIDQCKNCPFLLHQKLTLIKNRSSQRLIPRASIELSLLFCIQSSSVGSCIVPNFPNLLISIILEPWSMASFWNSDHGNNTMVNLHSDSNIGHLHFGDYQGHHFGISIINLISKSWVMTAIAPWLIRPRAMDK